MNLKEKYIIQREIICLIIKAYVISRGNLKIKDSYNMRNFEDGPFFY